jgi:hypothetical protein
MVAQLTRGDLWMDPARTELLYRLEHQHADGTWGEMVEQRAHHSPAEHDPERSWAHGRIFRCLRCPAAVTLIPEEEVEPPPLR